MADKKIRPELADTDADIAAYDEILIGFPIWWYVAPTIINTFLESYDFPERRSFCLQHPAEADLEIQLKNYSHQHQIQKLLKAKF